MATKAGSKESKIKRSKKFRGDDDYELLHSSRIYKLWYEFLQEADLVMQAWNAGEGMIRYWESYDYSVNWKKYESWAINGDIKNTIKTCSADKWRKEIFGTKDKKGDRWRELFGVKKVEAASKFSPGDLRHAESGNQSVSSNELLIKVNLVDNSRKDVDDAIQEILSAELKKLSRGRGKKIKKKNEAQFEINGVVDVRSLNRCLAIGKFDRASGFSDFRKHGVAWDISARLKGKFSELKFKDPDDLDSSDYRRVQRMISRDRARYKSIIDSVTKGRFDVS